MPAELRVEVLQSLFESDLGRIELPHRFSQAILGEIVRGHPARLRDQPHSAHRRSIVPVREHIDVGMGDSPHIQITRRLRQLSIGQASSFHQRADSHAKWLVASRTHPMFWC